MTKIQNIRHGVFETNSSSTHSICIPKKDSSDLIIPSHVELCQGEFGWEWDTLSSHYDKLSYLFTGLKSNSRDDDIDKLVTILEAKGITVDQTSSYKGYVDHSGDLKEFLDAVMEDENKLLNFLFSPLAFINTGNDNYDESVDICVSYEHDSYYKGN